MGTLFDNPLHLALLIVVIVLLFGASKLGDVGGALGKSIREFKKEAGKEDEKHARVQAPQASGYVPPATQSYSSEPPAAEQVRRPEYTPGDYRPVTPQQTPPPPATSSAPPDYSGR